MNRKIHRRPADGHGYGEQAAPGSDGASPNGRRYAFIGLSAGAGATTLAFAFADYLACGYEPARRAKTPVAVVELNGADRPVRGYGYDKVGIDRRFAGREYLSCYARVAGGRSIRGLVNPDGGVNWLLRVPGEILGTLETADFVRLAAGAAGDAILLDVDGAFGRGQEGARRDDAIRKIASDCDRVFAVIDPLPSAMMADSTKLELFKELESLGMDVRYIVNKMNAGVDRKEMRGFLRIRKTIEIPFIDPEDVYTAEYNCCTLYAATTRRGMLEAPFAAMDAAVDTVRPRRPFPLSRGG